ncbi:hypothetical protein [Cereibacter azotoformans]|nr:hypothetical protein [Cereibacter azotoformans]
MKPAEWARELRKAIARNKLPTYALTEEIGAGGAPMLRLHFRRLAL